MSVLLTINLLASCKDKTCEQESVTWLELQELLAKPSVRSKTRSEYQSASEEIRKEEKDGIAWIPCSLVYPNSGRRRENMQDAYLLVLDIDTGMALDDVRTRLVGLEGAIHSTYSHTPAKPKWRVVLPLKEPIPAHRLGEVFDHFQARFDGRLDASCGHDPARLYYLPACPKDAKDDFVFEHLEGEWLDAKAILDAAPVHVASSPVASRASAGVPMSMGVDEGGRNNEAFKRACAMIESGMDEGKALDALAAWNLANRPPLDEKELRAVVKSAKKQVEKHMLAATSELEEIVDRMNEKYAWIVKHSLVYRIAHRDFVSIERLRQHYANTKFRMNVGDGAKWVTHADVWHRSLRRRQHTNVDFMPGKPAVFEDKINLWEGWGVMPRPGDLSPWEILMDHIFGGDKAARRWFEQWLAFPLQFPGTKLTTATVLWSVKQGVGKSMIGETMCRLYGGHGKIISATELHGPFNGWMRATQFVLGEENSSSDRRADANRLKLLITSPKVHVNEKFQPAAETTNCANFMFTSNHADAFYLEDADRRFFVWEIKAGRLSDEFYVDFVDWRDNRGGAEALMDYLLKLDLSGFQPKGNAPMTDAKLEMIRQGKSDLERWLGEIVEDRDTIKSVFGKEVVHANDIVDAYHREHRCRTNSTAVCRALSRIAPYAKRRVTTRRRNRTMLMSLANHDKWEVADSTEWQAEYDLPSPVSV